MSNVDNELYELCMAVRRATQWIDTEQTIAQDPGNPPYRRIVNTNEFLKSHGINYSFDAPLYTSDYLDDKLPNGTTVSKGKDGNYGAWIVGREEDTFEESDSPIKARLKLTIALDDAGVKL